VRWVSPVTRTSRHVARLLRGSGALISASMGSSKAWTYAYRPGNA
jgi:hypothetical protein